tara:strand:+ start:573 stop:1013 length:441 start_codon:yes stop_codon:yes gene_type:complete
MNELDRFKTFLKQRGMLLTRERITIAETVSKLEEPFNIEKLREKLDHVGFPVSVSTLYRNIKLLAAAGLIENSSWNCSGKSTFRKLDSKPVSCTIKCIDCESEHSINSQELEKNILEICRKFRIEETGIVVRIEGRRKCNCKHKRR